MRVALVLHHVRPTGGQDRYGLELARRLSKSCRVDLVTIDAQGDLPAEVRVRRVAAPGRPLLLTAPAFQLLARPLIRSGGYDIVHGIGGAYPGSSVVTAQFCHAAWEAARTEAGLYQRLVTRQSVAHERETYRHASLRAVIAVSKRTRAEVERHYGPLRVPATVIPNAVDTQEFRPRQAPRPDGPPVILLVGAYQRKGLDTAIRALAVMEVAARLTAVGSGPREPYLALARKLGVAERVSLLSPTPRIADHYAAADAFVLPTRYEPFGMVIAEAMASGIPVVTSAAAGAADLVRDGVSGFVVADAEDFRGFANALDRILRDGTNRRVMGEAARSAVTGLTWDMVAEQTLAVYRSLR